MEQEGCDVLVPVVGRDVKGGEAGLGGHVGVVVVLEQQARSLGVVLLGRDVQGGKSHLAPRVILQKHGHDLPEQ